MKLHQAYTCYNQLHPEHAPRSSHVADCLANRLGPVIAATDYIQLYATQIREAILQPYYTLGTDGYGRSDTRVALRDHFEVDAKMIVYVSLKALVDQGVFELDALLAARTALGIDVDRVDPILS